VTRRPTRRSASSRSSPTASSQSSSTTSPTRKWVRSSGSSSPGGDDEENYITETRKELYGGDVVLEAETGTGAGTDDISTFGALGKAGDKSAWYSVSDTILGVKVTWVKIGVNYHTTSTRTDKVYGGWASHKNYVPFADFSHSPVQKWISANPGNNAHAETIWQGEWAGIDWDARERVWADQDGFKGGYLK
jgi:hypothetical protein